MQKKKILIIDDGATVIAWVKKNLNQAGYKTVSRNIAIGSGAAILREQPDLVLMDIMMPALQGDEIIRDFRKNKGGRDIRIVLHSSLALDELARRAKACGADGYIQKTNDPRRFIRQIKEHLHDVSNKSSKSNDGAHGQILVLSDKPFLTAAIKIMTSDYSQFRVLHVTDESEAEQILMNRDVINVLVVVVELLDDRPTLFSKTMSLLFNTHTNVPVILISKNEPKIDIEKRQNTIFIRSNPLSRTDLRNAVVAFLPPSLH